MHCPRVWRIYCLSIYYHVGLFIVPYFCMMAPHRVSVSFLGPAKIRAALGALGFVSPKPNREETIQEFVTRHLGTEVFERIIDPFVSGVYAGNPATLSMKAALKKVYALEDLGCTPSILEGAIIRVNRIAAEKKKNAERDSDLPYVPGGSLASFKNGLQSIPLKIKEILGGDRVRLNYKLINIERRGKEWFSTFQKGPSFNEINIIRSKYLLLTTPAYVVADLFQNNKQGDLPEAEELKKINYPPVASVTLAYPNEALKVQYLQFRHTSSFKVQRFVFS